MPESFETGFCGWEQASILSNDGVSSYPLAGVRVHRCLLHSSPNHPWISPKRLHFSAVTLAADLGFPSLRPILSKEKKETECGCITKEVQFQSNKQ